MTQNNLPGITRANHSNLGREFENELETVHEMYRLQRRADIRKIPHVWTFISENEFIKLKQKLPASMLARTEHGKYLQRTKSDVDFIGGGSEMFLAFDAKTVSGNTFPLANLEGHQLRNLMLRRQCGAIAGIMLKFNQFNRVFFVPATFLQRRSEMLSVAKFGKRRAAPGTASLSIPDLEKSALEIQPIRGIFDYLSTLTMLKNRA